MAPPLRRLPRAVLVALAAFLVLGGVLGTVQAAGGEASDGDRLVLPRPAIGDRWTYQAFLDGTWKRGDGDQARLGDAFPYAELEWLDPILVRDANGSEAAVDVLHLRHLQYSDSNDLAEDRDGHYWTPAEDRFLYSLGQTTQLAHEYRITSQQYGSTGQNGVVVGGVTPLQTDGGSVVEGWIRSFDSVWDEACLARNPFQGVAFDLDDRLEMGVWDCIPRFPDSWPGDGVSRFAGREQVAGHEAYRFDGDDFSIWFSPDVPVPVQIKAFDEESVAVLTLSSFHAGGTPLGTLAPQVGTSTAPPIAFGPRRPWGPDDSGVRHPWPASRAYQDALADPAWGNLRQWTAAHPKGTTFWLEYVEDLESTPQQRAWFFGLSDGSASFAFMAARQTVDALPVPGVAAARYSDLGFMSFFLDSLSPDPDLLPAELPTAASTLARWSSYEDLEGRSTVPNGWGMGLYCVIDCQYGLFGGVVAGRDPVAIMNVEGFLGQTAGVAPTGLLERSFTGSQLAVDAAGATTGLVNWTGYDTGVSLEALAGQTPVDPTTHPAEKRPLVLSSSFLPSPKQGAAIGLASILAGLLYWLWPSLKTGSFLGLFSRLEGPRLLAHPTRARLHALVEAEPGIHFQDLARKAGLPNGTAVHHLRKLDEAGLIAARPLGRYTCYFPGSSPTAVALEQAPILRSPGARLVFGAIQGSPGLSGHEVAARIGLQPSTVNYHVQRLVQVGLVASERDGRLVRLRAVG